jgi:conjugative relaxase-like TrwC/TraI family protein
VITTDKIKAGNTARVDYFLTRALGDEYPRTAEDRAEAISRYYGDHGAGPKANSNGRWLGRGADALGLTDAEASPEDFRRAVLEAYVDGAARAKPCIRTHPDSYLAAEPFAKAVRAMAEAQGIEPAELFHSGQAVEDWGRISRAADKFDTSPGALLAKNGRAVGIDPGEIYGRAEWDQAVKLGKVKVDVRLAAVDVLMTADKSVSLLYATGDEATRAIILREFHEANRAALGHMDSLLSTGRRGDGSSESGRTIATDGLLAVGFIHDEARPTGDCRCGDPHLHEHVIVLNTARGDDGKWSATQIDRAADESKTAGHLQEAEMRVRLREALGVEWRPVVNGLAGVVGVSDEAVRTFSKRHNDVEAEQAEIGEWSAAAANAAGRNTKQAKREQLPIAERVDYWRAEAVTVGLDPAEALDRPAARVRVVDRDGRDYAADVLGRLTEQSSSFNRSDLLRRLADDCRQGERVEVITARADAILTDPELVIPLAPGEAGLTQGDVRRSAGGRVSAYAVGAKWTTPAQLDLEGRLVDAAVRRVDTDTARADAELVERVIGRQLFVLSDEQATAVRGLTTSGNGVDVLHASAGTGKTTAVLGTVGQVYTDAGYRVIGAATSAKAARVLSDDAGLDGRTIASVLADMSAGATGGGRLSSRTVLVLDEASMTGTRDLAALLAYAEAAGAKVIVSGDDRQLAAVDSGGGFRGLRDRLGASTLRTNRRQVAEWERTALADLADGRPGEALRAYAIHDRVTVTDTGLGARRAMVGGWWGDVRESGVESTTMVAVRNADRVELNRLARDVMREAGRLGDDEVTAAGRTYAVGDRVMLLRNSARRFDNGDIGTVAAIDPERRVVVALDRGVTEALAPGYLTAGHLDHAYATTVYKAQGSTLETAHVLGAGLAQEAGYVALSRGRAANRLYLVEGEARADPELDLPTPASRGAYAEAAKVLSRSQAKRLALDTAAWGEDAAKLRAELAATAQLLRTRPASDTARLPGLRLEVGRREASLADAQTRLADNRSRLEQARRKDRPQLSAIVERQTGELARMQTTLAEVQATIAAAERGVSPRHTWEAGHTENLEAGVRAGRELSWRSRAERRAAQAVEPAIVEPQVVRIEPPVVERVAVRVRP